VSGLYAPSPDSATDCPCSFLSEPVLYGACGKETGVYALLPLEELVNTISADIRSMSFVNLQMIVSSLIVVDWPLT